MYATTAPSTRPTNRRRSLCAGPPHWPTRNSISLTCLPLLRSHRWSRASISPATSSYATSSICRPLRFAREILLRNFMNREPLSVNAGRCKENEEPTWFTVNPQRA